MQLNELKGVGKSIAEKLANLNVFTVQDLLFLLPNRYEDRTSTTLIADLQPGLACLFNGQVKNLQIKNFSHKSCLDIAVSDGSGSIVLRYWYFSRSIMQKFQVGKKLRIFGKVQWTKNRMFIVNHPEVEFISDISTSKLEPSYTAIYPTTDGIAQRQLRKIIQQALQTPYASQLQFLLPVEFCPQQLFTEQASVIDALKLLHQPSPSVDIESLQNFSDQLVQSLIYEELIAHQISWHKAKFSTEDNASYSVTPSRLHLQKLLELMPFKATEGQLKAYKEIVEDIQKPLAMQRLLQGDVGCGKTLVAAMVITQVVANGLQTCCMVPTELLAQQQYDSLRRWFDRLGYKTVLLTGKLKTKERASVLADIASGLAQVIVGTHTLFQETVEYQNLALLIIDEQHKFGVDQRLALQQKGDLKPHQMVMTATPIPRTLAMSLYGSMSQSKITQLPHGRKPITTKAISADKRAKLIERIDSACAAGQQVYWLCTLVKVSETLEAEAVEQLYSTLTAELPSCNINIVHGKQKSSDRNQIMLDFSSGKVQILIATTVIEVGVDVPNASIIVIENPERLGLSQLHQLRGRVGRSHKQSFCILLHKTEVAETAQLRIDALCKHQSGFDLAEIDLKMRGSGELLGTKQTGSLTFRIADLQRDEALLRLAQKNYRLVLQHPELVRQLVARWLPNREQYSQA